MATRVFVVLLFFLSAPLATGDCLQGLATGRNNASLGDGVVAERVLGDPRTTSLINAQRLITVNDNGSCVIDSNRNLTTWARERLERKVNEIMAYQHVENRYEAPLSGGGVQRLTGEEYMMKRAEILMLVNSCVIMPGEIGIFSSTMRSRLSAQAAARP